MTGLVYALATFTVVGEGLAGHWTLDAESYNSNTERITDKTPYENHGTNYGATLTTDQMGQSNRAMYFDGEEDYVNAGNDNSLQFGAADFSFSLWLRFDSLANHMGLITKGAMLSSAPYDNKGWALSFAYTVSRLYFDTYKAGQRLNVKSAKTDWVIDTWYYITIVRDGTVAKMYIDGELDNTGAAVDDIEDTTRNVAIGANSGGSSYFFNGSIDNVQIWDRVLSSDEIDTLYHSYRPKVASGSLQKGLVLDMPLTSKYTKDETVGSEIMTDRTPYSNDGQNYGATVGSDYTSFDGVDDKVNCGGLLVMPHVTVGVWANSSEIRDNKYSVVTKWSDYFRIQYQNGVIQCRLGIQKPDESIVAPFLSFGITGVDEWHYYVMTYDGDVFKIYLDGDFVTSYSQEGEAYAFILIDKDFFINDGRFKGLIDEVRIYNRALSDSEIKLLYDKGR